jgi:hypothetical protein
MPSGVFIVKLRGGLGNQLFQYAFAKYLQKSFNRTVCLDTSSVELENSARRFMLDKFYVDDEIKSLNLKDAVWNRILNNENVFFRRASKFILILSSPYSGFFIEGRNIYSEQKLIKSLKKTQSAVFDGYWQNLYYINEIKDELKQDLKIKEPLLQKFITENNCLIEKYKHNRKICLHIRRTDFINTKSIHLNYGKDYYKKAIEKLDISEQAVFLIFSDDIEWCKKNVNFIKHEVLFVDDDLLKNNSDFNQFMLMPLCDDFVIPNSTFSWWAAWLATADDKKVVCPEKWVKNRQSKILVDEWIKI